MPTKPSGLCGLIRSAPQEPESEPAVAPMNRLLFRQVSESVSVVSESSSSGALERSDSFGVLYRSGSIEHIPEEIDMEA